MIFVDQASVALTLEKETDKADLGHGTRAQVINFVNLMLTRMMMVIQLQRHLDNRCLTIPPCERLELYLFVAGSNLLRSDHLRFHINSS